MEAQLHLETKASEALLGELESHLSALREAAASEEAKVKAEALELKKKQGLEREELQLELKSLREEEEEQMRKEAEVLEREQEKI